MRVKKDRIFVITMGLVLANLVYWFSGYLSTIENNYMSAYFWAVLLADLFAIIGVLWLLRVYKKGRKVEKESNITSNKKEDASS